jgi:hypothetical protein
MKAIDIKSALLGLIIGVLVTLGVGASRSELTGIRRYQIGGTHSHGLVIDTVTGQVWQEFLPPGSGSSDPDFAKIKTNTGERR